MIFTKPTNGQSSYMSALFVAGIQKFTETIDMHGDAEGAYSALALRKDSSGNLSIAEVGTFGDNQQVRIVFLTSVKQMLARV